MAVHLYTFENLNCLWTINKILFNSINRSDVYDWMDREQYFLCLVDWNSPESDPLTSKSRAWKANCFSL